MPINVVYTISGNSVVSISICIIITSEVINAVLESWQFGWSREKIYIEECISAIIVRMYSQKSNTWNIICFLCFISWP